MTDLTDLTDATAPESKTIPITKREGDCCALLSYALKEGYLHHTLAFSAAGIHTYPPQIEGPRLSPRSRKKKPGFIIHFCPWCGAQLADDDAPGETG